MKVRVALKELKNGDWLKRVKSGSEGETPKPELGSLRSISQWLKEKRVTPNHDGAYQGPVREDGLYQDADQMKLFPRRHKSLSELDYDSDSEGDHESPRILDSDEITSESDSEGESENKDSEEESENKRCLCC